MKINAIVRENTKVSDPTYVGTYVVDGNAVGTWRISEDGYSYSDLFIDEQSEEEFNNYLSANGYGVSENMKTRFVYDELDEAGFFDCD